MLARHFAVLAAGLAAILAIAVAANQGGGATEAS
jgi:hypothetical protein